MHMTWAVSEDLTIVVLRQSWIQHHFFDHLILLEDLTEFDCCSKHWTGKYCIHLETFFFWSSNNCYSKERKLKCNNTDLKCTQLPYITNFITETIEFYIYFHYICSTISVQSVLFEIKKKLISRWCWGFSDYLVKLDFVIVVPWIVCCVSTLDCFREIMKVHTVVYYIVLHCIFCEQVKQAKMIYSIGKYLGLEKLKTSMKSEGPALWLWPCIPWSAADPSS